jgi:DNA-binding CsgD family transcriptional regulator
MSDDTASSPPTEIRLTARQAECLHRIASGETTTEIAAALGLSRHTVDHYIGTACARLGANSRVHAVAKALVRNLIEPPRAE